MRYPSNTSKGNRFRAVASYRRTQQDSGSSLNYNPDRMSTARLRLLFTFFSGLRHRGRIVDRLRTTAEPESDAAASGSAEY